MKLKHLQACILMLLIGGIVFFSCRKTSTTRSEVLNSKANKELVAKAKNEIFSKEQIVFSGHIKGQQPSNGTPAQGKGPCNYTFSWDFYYSIISLPCVGGVNDYRLDFTLYLYTSGWYTGPLLSDVIVDLNGYTLTNPTEYTYTVTTR